MRRDYRNLILLVVVIGSAGLRYFRNHSSDAAQTAQMDNYVVSVEVKNIRSSSVDSYLNEGDLFYLDENNQFFGTFQAIRSVSDAQKFYEMPDGTITSVPTRVSGDQYRVDVEFSLSTTGRLNDDGCFYLNGSRYIVLNNELKIHSKYVSFTAIVTDIAKAQ